MEQFDEDTDLAIRILAAYGQTWPYNDGCAHSATQRSRDVIRISRLTYEAEPTGAVVGRWTDCLTCAFDVNIVTQEVTPV